MKGAEVQSSYRLTFALLEENTFLAIINFSNHKPDSLILNFAQIYGRYDLKI